MSKNADRPGPEERERRERNFEELAAFLKPIVFGGDLDACGPLADWLDERGDSRGKLLRRRWQWWCKARLEAQASDDAVKANIERPWLDLIDRLKRNGAVVDEASVTVRVQSLNTRKADESLLRYIRERFPESWPAKSEQD